MVGSFRAQHFHKSRKFQELPRKWFHFKPLTPTNPGGAVLGDTGREGEEEGSIMGAGREEDGRREEEEWRREGGWEAGGWTNVGVRELDGRKLGGGRKGEGVREEGGRGSRMKQG